MIVSLRWYIIAFAGALFCASAAGQTTQPAPAAWEEVVANLALGLRDDSGTGQVGKLLTDQTIITAFGSSQNESRYRLQQQTGGLLLVAARGYSWPTETIASDLAASLEAIDALPPAIRAQFVPDDEADTQRCNETAQQWVASVLQPKPGQFIGVIMLWEQKPMTTSLLLGSEAGEPKQPLLLLVRGQQVGESEFQISRVAYGDVRQALD